MDKAVQARKNVVQAREKLFQLDKERQVHIPNVIFGKYPIQSLTISRYWMGRLSATCERRFNFLLNSKF
jgi:hypothetical protein